MKPISVVIPSFDGAKHLERTLPSVLDQRGVEFEVIVIENGKTGDDTELIVKNLQSNHTNLRFVSLSENQGYAGGVNAGVQVANHSLIAVLCNDNEAKSDWLWKLLEAYGNGIYPPTGRKISAIASRTELDGVDTNRRGTMNFFGRNVLFPDSEWTKKPLPIFYPGGNAFLFDRTLVGESPFESFYFTYQEDVSLGWRMRNKGYEVLFQYGSVVNSFDGGTTKKTPYKTAFLSERNRFLNLFTYPEWKTVFKLGPIWDLETGLSILFGKNRLAKVHAGLWIFLFFPKVLKIRWDRQKQRVVGDSVALCSMSSVICNKPCSRLKQILNSISDRYTKWVGFQFLM